MDLEHTSLVLIAKSFGLFCFIGASILVLIYALRPSSKGRFERAASSIIEADDKPVSGDRSSPDVTGDSGAKPVRDTGESSRSHHEQA